MALYLLLFEDSQHGKLLSSGRESGRRLMSSSTVCGRKLVSSDPVRESNWCLFEAGREEVRYKRVVSTNSLNMLG